MTAHGPNVQSAHINNAQQPEVNTSAFAIAMTVLVSGSFIALTKTIHTESEKLHELNRIYNNKDAKAVHESDKKTISVIKQAIKASEKTKPKEKFSKPKSQSKNKDRTKTKKVEKKDKKAKKDEMELNQYVPPQIELKDELNYSLYDIEQDKKQ